MTDPARGRCLARCISCHTGACRCNRYVYARTVDGFRECECKHSEQIHEAVKAPVLIPQTQGPRGRRGGRNY